MVELNNRNFLVSGTTANTFIITELDGSAVDSTLFVPYVSSGTTEKIYEISTNYTAAQALKVDYVQSGDIITIVSEAHPPAELSRTADLSWSLDDINFLPTTAQPESVTGAPTTPGAEVHEYCVTALNVDAEESFRGVEFVVHTIASITQANPAVVTTSLGHTLTSGDYVQIMGGGNGMAELVFRQFQVRVLTSTTYELNGVDSTSLSAYVNGSYSFPVAIKVYSTTPSSTNANVISWDYDANATEYNIYKKLNGQFGLLGISTTNSFSDIGVTPDTTIPPPSPRNVFLGANNFPTAVAYIQQRLTFANTNSETEKINMSRTGDFKNFTSRNPRKDDDSFNFNISGKRVNAVKALVDLGRLVILTSGGEWGAGDGASGLTASTLNLKQYSYNGSGDLKPIIIDGAAIYQQARGSIIRDLGFDFQIDGYAGNDLTIFSAHLFDKFTLVDWAFSQIPHSILWIVRSDGKLLGLTFVRNQQVRAWHIHDFDGFVESIASIPNGNEDYLYLTIKRTVNGKVKRYVERMSTRQITQVESSRFLDASVSYNGENTTNTTMTLSGGTTWAFDEVITLTSSAAFFLSSYVGDSIIIKDSSGESIRCSIVALTSTTIVSITPHKTVPVNMRGISFTTWSRAIDTITGLNHIEGKNVSVFGDGFVVASPNNASYVDVVVSGGKAVLDKPYSIIHVGLPYISDIETLDIDTSGGETIADKEKLVSRVSCYVEDTRGVWIGAKPPLDDAIDPLQDLQEVKIRSTENYDEPVSLATDVINVNIKPEWNSNGRVFIRQVDPIPMSILSINPTGKFPFNGG